MCENMSNEAAPRCPQAQGGHLRAKAERLSRQQCMSPKTNAKPEYPPRLIYLTNII